MNRQNSFFRSRGHALIPAMALLVVCSMIAITSVGSGLLQWNMANAYHEHIEQEEMLHNALLFAQTNVVPQLEVSPDDIPTLDSPIQWQVSAFPEQPCILLIEYIGQDMRDSDPIHPTSPESMFRVTATSTANQSTPKKRVSAVLGRRDSNVRMLSWKQLE